jgi:RNA polymerase sigma factor (TIGR02999 family)
MSERRLQVQQIAKACRDLEAEKREAYIAEACGDDAWLIAQVKRVLAADTPGFDYSDFGLPESEPSSPRPRVYHARTMSQRGSLADFLIAPHVQYLLGELSEVDRDRFEDRYLADDTIYEQLLTVEDDLVDSYVRGELSPSQREHFERHFLSSPGRREKVDFARAFDSVLEAREEEQIAMVRPATGREEPTVRRSDVMDLLKELAGRMLRKHPKLDPADLVREVYLRYLRLVGQAGRPWKSREDFFSWTATVLRRLLVERAREASRPKPQVVPLPRGRDNLSFELVAIEAAFNRLAEQNRERARVVELRLFGGLSDEEIAVALGVSKEVVKEERTAALAWLNAELRGT